VRVLLTEDGSVRFRVDTRDDQDRETARYCRAFLNDIELERCLMADELAGVAIIIIRRHRDALPETVVLSGQCPARPFVPRLKASTGTPQVQGFRRENPVWTGYNSSTVAQYLPMSMIIFA